MNIAVRYLAQLRQAAGRSGERIDLPDPCDIAGLVRHLAANDERLRQVLLDNGGGIRRTILIFLGDEQVGRDRALRDGDEVTLMTPIAGGAA